MSVVPGLSYFELLAYTEEETRRWREYFAQNPKALEVAVGGKHQDVRGLITHIFASETRWGQYLHGEKPTPPEEFRPQSVEEVWKLGEQARQRLNGWVSRAGAEDFEQMIPVFARTYNKELQLSKRKVLTHCMIHGIRHWAQIATALRQACFTTDWSHDVLFSPALR